MLGKGRAPGGRVPLQFPRSFILREAEARCQPYLRSQQAPALPMSPASGDIPRQATQRNTTCCQPDPEPPAGCCIPAITILSSRRRRQDKPTVLRTPSASLRRETGQTGGRAGCCPPAVASLSSWMRPRQLDAVPAVPSRVPGPAPASVVLAQRMPEGKARRRLAALDSSRVTAVRSSLGKARNSKRAWQLRTHRRRAARDRSHRQHFMGGG